jgi:septum formation protein
MNVILASASPRRQELLKEIVPAFEIVVADVDEEALVHPDPEVTARETARAKARAVARLRPESTVIGGDTVVALGDEQLVKPVDEADAFRILRKLSGRTHRVITGMCIAAPGQEKVFTVTSFVTFHDLSDEQIEAYIATGEPMDKAGAYGAQGEAGKHIARIEGSITNVIGLPVEEVRLALRALEFFQSV